jgi:putative flippase GtrA
MRIQDILNRKHDGDRHSRWVASFLKFMFVGGFVFVWGIGLNIVLVSVLHQPKLASYAGVVVTQAVIGFLTSRYFVFDGRGKCIVRTGIGFIVLFSLFRLADWLLYSFTVGCLEIPYLVAQIANNILFFLAKFVAYRVLFEGRAGRSALE